MSIQISVVQFQLRCQSLFDEVTSCHVIGRCFHPQKCSSSRADECKVEVLKYHLPAESGAEIVIRNEY